MTCSFGFSKIRSYLDVFIQVFDAKFLSLVFLFGHLNVATSRGAPVPDFLV